MAGLSGMWSRCCGCSVPLWVAPVREPLARVRRCRASACIPFSRALKASTPVLSPQANGMVVMPCVGRDRSRSTWRAEDWSRPDPVVEHSSGDSLSYCTANAAAKPSWVGFEAEGVTKSRDRSRLRSCCPMRLRPNAYPTSRWQSALKTSATRITRLSGQRMRTPPPKPIPTTTRPGCRSGWIPSAVFFTDRSLAIRTGNRRICSSAPAVQTFVG